MKSNIVEFTSGFNVKPAGLLFSNESSPLVESGLMNFCSSIHEDAPKCIWERLSHGCGGINGTDG